MPTPALRVSGISRSGYTTGTLVAAARVYVDQTTTFTTPIPSSCLRQVYILTRNADKNSTGTSFLSFDVNQTATVMVGIDERIAAPPAWLQGWTRESAGLVTTDPACARRVLYSKTFPSGRVTLGGNRDANMPTGRSMYTVVVMPYVTSAREWPLYSELLPPSFPGPLLR